MTIASRIMLASAVFVAAALLAQEKRSAGGAEVISMDQGQWTDAAGLTGVQKKTLHAEPGQEPTDMMVRRKSGTSTPLHWHSSVESLYVLAGEHELILKNGEKFRVRAGGFIRIPARAIHRIRCAGTQDCVTFAHTGAPFDVHYVDEKGKEIARPK